MTEQPNILVEQCYSTAEQTNSAVKMLLKMAAQLLNMNVQLPLVVKMFLEMTQQQSKITEQLPEKELSSA